MLQEAGAFLHRRVLCSQIKSVHLGRAHIVEHSESLTCRFSRPQWLAGVSAISEVFYSPMDTTDASVEGWAPENLAMSACARRAESGFGSNGSDLQFVRSHLRTGNRREREYSTSRGEPLLRYRSNAIECAIGLRVVNLVRRSTVDRSPSCSAKMTVQMMPAHYLY